MLLSLFIVGYCYADKTYTIVKGDNPDRIAKKFNIKTDDIVRINNLDPRKLKPGMKIIIPSNNRKSANITNLSNKQKDSIHDKNQADNLDEDNLIYVVKKGDTLTSISKRYGVSVKELKKLNQLSSSRLKIDQQLIIREQKPKVYTVKKDDTIYAISKRFKINIEELKEINSLETYLLKPGQKILLEKEKEADLPKIYDAIISKAPLEEEILSSEDSQDVVSIKERLLLFAKKLLDIPYRFGGNSILGIDCSAYVKKVYSLQKNSLLREARLIKKTSRSATSFFSEHMRHSLHMWVFILEITYLFMLHQKRKR